MSSRNTALVEQVGAISVGTLAFGTFSGTTLATLALVPLLVCFAYGRQSTAFRLRKTSVFRLTVVLAATILLRTAWAGWEQPDAAMLHWSDGRRWLMLCLFVPFAYCFARSRLRLEHVVLLAGGGLLMEALLSLDTRAVQHIWHGGRWGFGFPIVPWGAYAALAVLALLVFGPRVLLMRGRWRWVARIAWFLALLFFLEGMLASQARGPWIAFLVAAPAAMTITAIGRAATDVRRVTTAGFAVAVLLAGSAAAVVNNEMVIARLSQEQDVLARAMTADIGDIPYTSVGLRLHAAALAFDYWHEQPLFGHGPAATEQLLAAAPAKAVRSLVHLHNTYLEILVRFGGLGQAVFIVMFAGVARDVWRAYRVHAIDTDHLAFLVGAHVIVALWFLTDFRLINPDGRFFWILLLGITWGVALRPKLARAERTALAAPPGSEGREAA